MPSPALHFARGGPRRAVGLNGFGTGEFLQTASPGGIAGVNTGFWVYFVFARTDLTTNTNAHVFNRLNAAFSQGWTLAQSSGSNFVFACCSNTGVFIQSPAWTMTSPAHVNKICRVVGVHTGSAVRIHANGAQVGATSAITGYTPFSGVTKIGHSSAHGGFPSTFTFYAAGGGAGVPSAADIAAWDAALVASDNMRTAMPNVPAEHSWVLNSLGTAVDSPGTDDMSITGTLTLATAQPPVYA